MVSTSQVNTIDGAHTGWHALFQYHHYFVEMVPFLMKLPGATAFFSSRINQDPLEKFFGMQRQSGKANENPTTAEFIKNTENFRIINSWIQLQETAEVGNPKN